MRFVAAWHVSKVVQKALGEEKGTAPALRGTSSVVRYINLVNPCFACRSPLHTSKPRRKQSERKLVALSGTQEGQARCGTPVEHQSRAPCDPAAGLAVWCGFNHPDIFIITGTGSRFWSSETQTNVYGLKTFADGSKVPVQARDLAPQCEVITTSTVEASVVVIQHLANRCQLGGLIAMSNMPACTAFIAISWQLSLNLVIPLVLEQSKQR